jgi:hypothetical protein
MKRLLLKLIYFFIFKEKNKMRFKKNHLDKYSNNSRYYMRYLQFYGQFSPRVDEVVFKRYFGSTSIRGTCIECGANDGLSGTNSKFFEDAMYWDCHNIEPEPRLFKKLLKNRPKSKNYQIALSDKKGELEFVSFSGDMSGLNCAKEHFEKNIIQRGGDLKN